MQGIFQQLIHWVELHPTWSGIIIFLVAMTESLAIVGLIIPGVAIMFGIGALISTGAIEFWPALAWAIAGAIAGDVGSFLLGFSFRDRITTLWPFNRYQESLEQGQEFFTKYGAKSVVLGRFFGPMRAVVPLIAGTMSMQPWRFILASVLASLIWAPAYLAPGIVFGASLELAAQVSFRLVILLVLLVVLIWLVYWLIRFAFRLCQPHASSWLQSFLSWSRLHPAFKDTANALADPKHPEAKGLAIMATLLLLAAGILVLLLGAVLGSTALAGTDLTVLNSLKSLHNPWADHLMLASSRMADSVVIAVLIIAVSLFLALQKHWRTLWYWLAAAGFALLASYALKYGLQIQRPPNQVTGLDPYSFPSGHTLRATVIYGFLALIIARSLGKNWRWLPYSLAGIIILLVAISRIYLGVHWLSDILGSITLGVLWVTILGIVYYRHTDAETNWLGLSLGSILVIAIVSGYQGMKMHSSDLANYMPKPEVTEMAAADWSTHGWLQLPGRRKDVREKLNHPLNIQHAGKLDSITATLKQEGWSEATPLSWGNALKLLSSDLPIEKLPLPPQVHDGRHEALALTKAMPNDRRLVLRLWPAFVNVQPGAKPLWIGNVTEQLKQEVVGIFTVPVTSEIFEEPFEILLEDSAAMPHKLHEAERDVILWRGSN